MGNEEPVETASAPEYQPAPPKKRPRPSLRECWTALYAEAERIELTQEVLVRTGTRKEPYDPALHDAACFRRAALIVEYVELLGEDFPELLEKRKLRLPPR